MAAILSRRGPVYQVLNGFRPPRAAKCLLVAFERPKRPEVFQRAPRPKPKNGPYTSGGLTQPPDFSYDPALEAQRRAAERGLDYTLEDIGSERFRTKQDFRTSQQDVRLAKRRGLQDIRIDRKRGIQDIGLKRKDIRTDLGRSREDFGIRLKNLVTNYARQGSADRQAINAAGVAEGGALAASNRVRGENMREDLTPLLLGRQRTEEDAQTAMRRLGISAQRLRRDSRIGTRRLKADVAHDLLLNRRSKKRTLRDLFRQEQRAITEQRLGDADLIREEIYQAMQLNPGEFKDLKPDFKNYNSGGRKKKRRK